MNYFGHAAVATWYGASPGALLGAMLPDFATMSGARLAAAPWPASRTAAELSPAGEPSPAAPAQSPPDAEIMRGVDLHHATDGAFHQLAPVLALMRELDARLDALGCARGPRRAIAHVGVELLLDGVLVDAAPYREGFLAGIAHDPSGAVWREPDDPRRIATLLARMQSYGVPDDLRRPESIVHRLSRMLAHRKLLAPSASDLSAARTALTDLKPRIDVATDTVLRALRVAVDQRTSSPT